MTPLQVVAVPRNRPADLPFAEMVADPLLFPLWSAISVTAPWLADLGILPARSNWHWTAADICSASEDYFRARRLLQSAVVPSQRRTSLTAIWRALHEPGEAIQHVSLAAALVSLGYTVGKVGDDIWIDCTLTAVAKAA